LIVAVFQTLLLAGLSEEAGKTDDAGQVSPERKCVENNAKEHRGKRNHANLASCLDWNYQTN
jgi:hypothetical protein